MRHPKVLDMLRGEIDSVADRDKNITRAYIQRMPYLQNVIKESESCRSKTQPYPSKAELKCSTSTLPAGASQYSVL